MIINRAQRSVIETESQRIVVPSGPGSGKSSTMIARVRHRVGMGIDPERMWCITFTQNGAKVMSDKLKSEGIAIGYVGTRHALCFKLLNKFGNHVGFRQGSIAMVDDRMADEILRNAAKSFGYKGSEMALQTKKSPIAVLAWKELRHQLRRQNCITYDMALEYGLRLIQTTEVARVLGVDELLCDEAQDNSDIDWQIDEAIPARVKLWVGDVDQSIFQFRGSNPQGFISAARREETEVILLENNYRSDRDICAAANALIERNTDRIQKQIRPMTDMKGVVRVTGCADAHREAYTITRRIMDLHERPADPVPLNEIAVLCRANWLADELRNTIAANGVTLAKPTRQDLPHDWPLALASLAVMMNPRNDLAAAGYMKLREVPLSVFNRAKIEALNKRLPLLVCARIEYPVARDTIEDSIVALGQFLGMQSLKLISKRLNTMPMREPTLADLLHDLWRPDSWGETATEGLFVGTVHASKGMEFDHVIVAGMEEGIFPANDSDIEEERRLAFVAVTRARHSVTLTNALQRTRFQKTTAQKPSRFLLEIPTN